MYFTNVCTDMPSRFFPHFCCCCLSVLFVAESYAQDYRIYHTWINNAERYFFLENKPDSAFHYYDSAFANYDFVFAKDCYMAAQIALSRKNDRYIAYLKKGFENGLTPRHLAFSKVLRPISDSTNFKKKFPGYQALRRKYLARIQINVRRMVMRHECEDQCEKNELSPIPYSEKLNKHIEFIEHLVSSGTFPGDKLIGLDQNDIMKELGFPGEDYKDQYEHYKTHNVSASQFEECGECLAQAQVFPLLVHHYCIFNLLSSNWNKLIISGQIHPRDVALLFDNHLRFGPDKQWWQYNSYFYCKNELDTKQYYKNNLFVHYRNIKIDNRVIDSMRKCLFMNTLAVDSARESYGKLLGFKTDFGFWKCR